MVPANAVHRVLKLKYKNFIGACFTIEVEETQYLVTARHLVEGISSGDNLVIYEKGQPHSHNVNVIGIGEKDIDIAVLSTPNLSTQRLPCQPSADGLRYSQLVYFLGFPFGEDGGLESLNWGFPVPLVKSGIISMFERNRDLPFYIDAYGCEGFSGGPVVFNNEKGDSCVAGVVSEVINFEGQIDTNSGFVAAYGIHHAIRLIERNRLQVQQGTTP